MHRRETLACTLESKKLGYIHTQVSGKLQIHPLRKTLQGKTLHGKMKDKVREAASKTTYHSYFHRDPVKIGLT